MPQQSPPSGATTIHLRVYIAREDIYVSPKRPSPGISTPMGTRSHIQRRLQSPVRKLAMLNQAAFRAHHFHSGGSQDLVFANIAPYIHRCRNPQIQCHSLSNRSQAGDKQYLGRHARATMSYWLSAEDVSDAFRIEQLGRSLLRSHIPQLQAHLLTGYPYLPDEAATLQTLQFASHCSIRFPGCSPYTGRILRDVRDAYASTLLRRPCLG
jgi:hypothetical protein